MKWVENHKPNLNRMNHIENLYSSTIAIPNYL